MSAPECLHGSPIADANGFVDVDKVTMQHKKFDNIFALGDCANSPNGKTAAAVAGQSGVVRNNLFALLANKPMPAQVSGYSYRTNSSIFHIHTYTSRSQVLGET